MLNKRPHILKYVNSVNVEPERDENGDWIVSDVVSELIEIGCRAEPNGTGQMINTEDGVTLMYSWTVFLGIETLRIPFGTEVKLFEGSEEVSSGTVKRFSRDQKHCRLWL